jgi:imidazolonepropionase-like amidohydrolase
MSRTLIKNALIFDGSSAELIEGGSVLVEGDTIREVSSRSINTQADIVIDAAGRMLMPGLIDLHTHFHITDVNIGRGRRRTSEYIACWTVAQLRATLDRGFTAIRDAGGAHSSYARAIERGIIPGPRYYTSGRVMSQTGGHGDYRDAEDETVWDACPMCHNNSTRFAAIVDSPDEMRKAVREELRRGAAQIKIHASGGVSSTNDPLDRVQFSEEEIRVAVAEATRHGTYVMAHCHPSLSIRRAAEMGIRCIEHASFIDDETARFLASKGTYAVPTLAVAHALHEDGRQQGYPPQSLAKLEGLLDHMLIALERMARAGVKMGFGTDLLGPHQERQLSEFSLRRRVLPAIDVLRSATSVAAEILRAPGKLGCIAAGAYADIIVLDGNPLRDISVLTRGAQAMPMVMKAGQFHRNLLS